MRTTAIVIVAVTALVVVGPARAGDEGARGDDEVERVVCDAASEVARRDEDLDRLARDAVERRRGDAPPIAGVEDARTTELPALIEDRLREFAAGWLRERFGRGAAWVLDPRAEGTFRLGVIPVELKDQARDPRFTDADLERALFSRGAYTGTSPSGERVHGSMADYMDENSCGRFRLEGAVLPTVRVRASREELAAGWRPLSEMRLVLGALARVERALGGPAALEGFDAVAFVIAGTEGPHATSLWPHASAVPWRGRLLRYYVTSEKEARGSKGGEARFSSIGVHCHEFGHVLGILDKYGTSHPGGVGVFCVMAVGHRGGQGTNGHRPFHFCAVCKERLGWLEPAVVDPRTPQRLRLRGVEGRAGEALKVLVDPRGREYFLLENRRHRGFDEGFPRPGLLIWHVGEWGQRLRNRVPFYDVDIEEAHGENGRDAPHKDLARVPFPLPELDRFTPETKPSSASIRPWALPVWITEIREQGEAITFRIGAPRGRRRRSRSISPENSRVKVKGVSAPRPRM